MAGQVVSERSAWDGCIETEFSAGERSALIGGTSNWEAIRSAAESTIHITSHFEGMMHMMALTLRIMVLAWHQRHDAF